MGTLAWTLKAQARVHNRFHAALAGMLRSSSMASP